VAASSAAAQVRGTAFGPDSEPAAGAIVAVVAQRRSEPSAVVVAGADGTFRATVPAGTYALTATHPEGVAGWSPTRRHRP
jgi:ABC-type sugar transport system substrate-binding protein